MEFYEVEKLNNWYFKIKLPLADRRRCSYNEQILKYLYAIGRHVKSTQTAYLYQEELNDGEFIFQIGYASFVYNEFFNQLSKDSLKLLEDIIFAPDTTLPVFNDLYEYQSDDLSQLLKYNRGMFQVYTGYGKSEVISTLANYVANVLHERVIILVHSSTSLQEITNRLYHRFNIEVDYYNSESFINVLSTNGFLRSYQYDPNDEFWKNEFWILSDEVENCVSETAMAFYENLPNVKRIYGFSATSDKKNADPVYSRVSDDFLESDYMISLIKGPFSNFNTKQRYCQLVNEEFMRVKDILGRNKFLVGYYGSSIVFRKPDNFNISMIDVTTSISKDDIELPAEYNYNEIIFNLFTDDRMCRLIESIAYKVGTIFIPMARLQVIDYWVDNYFKKEDYLVLVISSRGYELYENGEFMGLIDLDEMKRLVKLDLIGVILGTKSSYSALDLPELKRSLLLYSKSANVVIQAIGRTARCGKFEIYNICPLKNIPTYSKDYNERKELILNYYKDCKVTQLTTNENMYGC